jgi:response regulator RpfG family c-di-GMP phosphodiesterase
VTKLLYVEDNDDNVYMLKMRLELLGDFEVVAAENGERGCEMALAERPDIILMDLEMPIVDGWEATRRLKSNPETRDIPIIAFSLVYHSPEGIPMLQKPYDTGRCLMSARRTRSKSPWSTFRGSVWFRWPCNLL